MSIITPTNKKFKPYTLVSTRNMPRQQWLAMRRKGIGGSDCAAILGRSRWKSAYSVWVDKMGYADNKETEALRQGRDFEEYVAKRFVEETGKRVYRANQMYIRKDKPWMLANIDRRVFDDGVSISGLECKTSNGLWLREFKNGAYPDEYYFQCQHYMAVTGAKKWYLCVLVFQQEPQVYEILRDEDDIRILEDAEEAFWKNHIETAIEPPIDGSDSTARALGRFYSRPDSTMVINETDILERLTSIKDALKDIEASKKSLENLIKAEIGDSDGMISGEYSATWRIKTRDSFDSKRFVKDNPSIDVKKYIKTATYRELRVYGAETETQTEKED
ncbi:hypothetical protein FACS1894184_19230 [Clostridia bacterium]|nr:hypothetical protein FACS1894184_19230 [Clostridia bacterium]